jgi:phosphoserine phosphatase
MVGNIESTEWVATLVAEGSNLTDAAIQQAQLSIIEYAGSGVGIEWLKPRTACDISWHGAADAALMTQLLAVGAEARFDVALQSAKNRRKKLLLSDMDSTMIEQECIDEMAASLGIKPEIAEITERSMRGEIRFEEALEQRVGLLKYLPVAELQKVYDAITFSRGARELISAFKQSGGTTLLVSGGFTFFTGRVAKDLGFDAHLSNELEINDDRLAGLVKPPIFGASSKLEALLAWCENMKISTDEAVAIGDGANDLPMLERAGLGIGYYPKPKVQAALTAPGNGVIRFGTLATAGYFLGL